MSAVGAGPRRTVTGVRLAAATHRGLVRAENQDCVVVGGWLAQDTSRVRSERVAVTGSPLTVAVLDGMGGHAGGGIASLLAARELAARSSGWAGAPSAADVDDVVGAMSQAVRSVAAQAPALADMGTTVAGVVVTPHALHVLNVGDSRVLRLRGGYLGQLSVDDRVVDPTGVRAGLLSQVLGPATARPDPHHLEVDVEDGDVLVLCTDGLSDVVDAEQVVAELAAARSAGDEDLLVGVAALVGRALQAGAPDNVSVVCCALEVVVEEGSS